MNNNKSSIHVIIILIIGILLVTVGVLGYKVLTEPKEIQITEEDFKGTAEVNKKSKKITAKEVIALVDKYYKPFQGDSLLPNILDHLDEKNKNSIAINNIDESKFELVDIKKDLNGNTFIEYNDYCEVNTESRKINPNLVESKYKELFDNAEFYLFDAYGKGYVQFNYINNLYVEANACFGPSPEKWNYKATSYEEFNNLLIVSVEVTIPEETKEILKENFEESDEDVNVVLHYNIVFEKRNDNYVLVSSYKTKK